MQRVRFTNSRGQSVEFGSSPPYVLTKIDGLGDVEAEIQTQKAPFQDGSSYINSFLEERHITIQIGMYAAGIKELSKTRSEFSSIFNPKLGEGTLQYIYGDEVKEITVVSESIPILPSGRDNRIGDFQMAMVSLKCPSPYWLSKDDQVDSLAVYEGGLTFPLSLSTTFSIQSESKSKIITNEGHESTPLLITFTGPATAPIRITNETTSEFIEVNQNLLQGEELVINTEFGKKKVVKVDANGNETNAFHYINLQSSFFQLVQGNNLLSYSTGAAFERAPVVLTWRNRYVGV